MNPVGVVLAAGAAATAGAAVHGLRKQAREQADQRAGLRRPAYAADVTPPPAGEDRLSRWFATWVPEQPRTTLGRVLAVCNAAPATALGIAFAATTGGRWRWDDAHACWVVEGGQRGAAALQRAMGSGANGVGHVVISRSERSTPALVAHEAVHVRQHERFGVLLLPLYVWLLARWGYHDHPLERAARLGAAREVGADVSPSGSG